MIKRRNILLFMFISLFIAPLYVSATQSIDIYKVKYKCPVRLNPDENADTIKNGNDTVYVYENQDLDYISSALGKNNGKANQTWYKVNFDYAARNYTGYVAKACMYDTKTYSYSDESAFEENIKSFPDSYKPYLRKLHAVHSNWFFTTDETNLDWNASVTAESQKGQSAISYLYPSLFYRDDVNPNGIIVDGKSWYAPCYDAVAYYLDPRNFLNEKNIFMFESLVYNSNQDKYVQGILDGSFMEGTFLENGVKKTYASAFIEAAKESGVSSIHLASRALQEMGHEMSSAASGTVEGYEGYYNFYNIGATSGADNYLKGLEKAKKEGWNSIQKAITGGAKFISTNYVNNGKDTIYFQKFNVSSKRTTAAYTYEYMTNIMAPASESSSIYKTYSNSGKLNDSYTFRIPVYKSMTNEAYKVSKVNTIGGNEEIKEEEKPKADDKKEEKKEVVSPEVKVAKSGYDVSTGFLTKVGISTDMGTLRNNLSKNGAVVATLNSSWNSKVSGIIATGDIIEIDGSKKYEVVIYGDVAGDSGISVVDLLYLKKYIIGDMNLGNANKKAADISKDGKVDVVDLLLLKKSILGEYNVEQ